MLALFLACVVFVHALYTNKLASIATAREQAWTRALPGCCGGLAMGLLNSVGVITALNEVDESSDSIDLPDWIVRTNGTLPRSAAYHFFGAVRHRAAQARRAERRRTDGSSAGPDDSRCARSRAAVRPFGAARMRSARLQKMRCVALDSQVSPCRRLGPSEPDCYCRRWRISDFATCSHDRLQCVIRRAKLPACSR
jgi:hypothetical protein